MCVCVCVCEREREREREWEREREREREQRHRKMLNVGGLKAHEARAISGPRLRFIPTMLILVRLMTCRQEFLGPVVAAIKE